MDRPKLLILSHDVIFQGKHSEDTQSKLVQIINKGYDKPRFKYNIIKTLRIKNSLAKDLCIEDLSDTVIGICLHPDPNWAKDHDIVFGLADIDTETVTDLEFEITDSMYRQVIGTVGLKPMSATSMEITALTSFYPKLGATLVELIENYMLNKMSSSYKNLYAHVIVDHELVPFYSKLGFQEIETSLVEVDPQTGKVVGGDLEDGIELSKSFELALMIKKF